MGAKILQQDRLPELVDELISTHEVIGPKDELSYGRITSASAMYLSDKIPVRSLKEFLFPQREVLVEFQLAADQVRLTTPTIPADVARVVFASCPCDAAAFPILDQVFAWDYMDSSYLQRRENTVIISIACENPDRACFCVSVGGSPIESEGSDLLFTPLGEVYHVEIVTGRGKALVAEHAAFFRESNPEINRQRSVFEERSRAKITKQVDVTGLPEALSFDNPVWETVAEQCTDCGTCTYLCPTCHCFDIQDEGSSARQGERVRLWDACAFADYTRAHAGQPRPAHYRRYRQRIMHKFKYYQKNFGETLCVGCGRCIRHCPVSVDITQVIKAVRE